MAVNTFKKEILEVLPRKIDECNYKGNVDDIKHLSALFFRPNAKGCTDFVGTDREEIRKYIFDHEEDMYDVCRIGISRGDLSSLMYTMRVNNPKQFLAYTAYAASVELMRSTPLADVRNFKLDDETKSLVKDELKMAQLNYDSIYANLIVVNKLRDVAYDLYRKDWLRNHDSSIEEERKTILTLLKEGKKEFGKEYSIQDAEHCYLNSHGVRGSGEIYASQNEFLDVEYNDKEYMKYLLPPKMYRAYQMIEFIVEKDEPKAKLSVPIKDWEQETADYLKTLDSKKVIGRSYMTMHDFLDELGVSKEKHDDCYQLLKNSHFGNYEGDFSVEKCEAIPVQFTKALEEDFTYAINNLIREKKFMNYTADFKKEIYDKAQQYWDVAAATGVTKKTEMSLEKFERDVFSDFSKVSPFLSYTDKQIWNKIMGVPYKETKSETLTFKLSNSMVRKLEVGKMWRDIDLKYDGYNRDLLYKQMDKIVSCFQHGQMQWMNHLFEDLSVNYETNDYLLKIRDKYLHTVKVKENKKDNSIKNDLGR